MRPEAQASTSLDGETRVIEGNWCPRCGNRTLQERLTPPFGGWCSHRSCTFTVPECNHPREYSEHIAREAGIPWRAISVHAPWAWALMWGGKDVENRGGRGKRLATGARSFPRTVTGRVWVHASKWPVAGKLRCNTVPYTSFYEETIDALRRASPVRPAGDIIDALDELRGRIVGSIDVYGYREPDDPPDSPWYVPGSLAIMVRDAQPLKKPVLAKGALGWWTVPVDVLEQLKGQVSHG